MRIQLSEHFDYKKLIRFTLPTIIMMIFSLIYGVIDGAFVSNGVGSDAFAAVNLIMPVLMILGSIGYMIGTLFLTPFLLQNCFQSFVVVAETPLFGLLVSIVSAYIFYEKK